MKKTNFSFSAPTESIELEIVEFCLNKLDLKFGDFWYKWFDSSNNPKENHTLHIDCNKENLEEIIRKELTFLTTFRVTKIFKVKPITLPEYEEFKYQYYIHFKTEPIN